MPTNRVTVSNAVQLQQALTDAATQPISVIRIDQDIINITTPLILPSTLFTPGKHLVIQGNGTTIQPNVPGAVTHLMRVNNPQSPNALDYGTANTMLNNRFTIQDITFNGRNSNVVGLELTATKQSEIRNCRFIACNAKSISLLYAPETRVLGCYSFGCSGIGIEVAQAILSNVPPVMQNQGLFGSPFTRIQNCIIENESGTFAAISVVGSGNCIISQFISRPKAPRYHIYFDSNGYVDANSIFIDNVSFEVGPPAPIQPVGVISTTGAGIKLKMLGGFAKISGIVTNGYSTVAPLISAESSLTNPQATLPRVFVEHYPIIYQNIKFETGGACSDDNVIWSFFDVDDGRNIFVPSRWVNTVVPTYRKSEYFDNSNEIVTNSMKVNNNVISA